MAKHNNLFEALNNEQLSNTLLESYKKMITDTGDTSFSRFSETIMDILKDSVKPHSVRGSRKQDRSHLSEASARFKGRGNGWAKLDLAASEMSIIKDKLSTLDNSEDFEAHCSRNGFVHLRFVKCIGTPENIQQVFELRTIDPKVVHPKEYHVTLPLSAPVELLGGTPISLKLLEVPAPEQEVSLEDTEPQEDELVTEINELNEEDFFANV